jgi:hypothetical protein
MENMSGVGKVRVAESDDLTKGLKQGVGRELTEMMVGNARPCWCWCWCWLCVFSICLFDLVELGGGCSHCIVSEHRLDLTETFGRSFRDQGIFPRGVSFRVCEDTENASGLKQKEALLHLFGVATATTGHCFAFFK